MKDSLALLEGLDGLLHCMIWNSGAVPVIVCVVGFSLVVVVDVVRAGATICHHEINVLVSRTSDVVEYVVVAEDLAVFELEFVLHWLFQVVAALIPAPVMNTIFMLAWSPLSHVW